MRRAPALPDRAALPAAMPSGEDRRELARMLLQAGVVELLALGVGALSLLAGTAPDYVLVETLSLLLLLPLVHIIRSVDRFTGSVMLASLLKVFWISQLVTLLFWRPADQPLQQPLATATAVTVGAMAAIAGMAATALLFRPAASRLPLLTVAGPGQLGRLGLGAALVGLPAQGIWGFLSGSMATSNSLGLGGVASGLILLFYLAPLATLSLCCFAADALIRSDGRRLFSRPLLIVLTLYMAEVAPLAVKTAPLKPVIALAAAAMAFRWKPSPGPIVGGLALLLFVSGILYPTVNVARLRAMASQRALPEVLMEEIGQSLADPDHFAANKAESERYERDIGQSFYGRPVGFLDRFTPLTTDRLVGAAANVPPIGTRAYLVEAFSGLLPRTFGFERDATARQVKLEAGMTRKRMEGGKVGWDNTGFVADAYFAGGLVTVAATFFVVALLFGTLGRVTFGPGIGSVLWIPFFVEYMFAPADVTLFTMMPSLTWNWLFLSAAMWALLLWSRPAAFAARSR